MPEDFPNGQKGICRLPAVSPLMYSTTEAKLPNQTPSKTLVISASAAMPKDLPLWAERNRKIDALRLRYDRQTSCLFRLAQLGNTVAVSRLQPFSVSLRKPEDSALLSPVAGGGNQFHQDCFGMGECPIENKIFTMDRRVMDSGIPAANRLPLPSWFVTTTNSDYGPEEESRTHAPAGWNRHCEFLQWCDHCGRVSLLHSTAWRNCEFCCKYRQRTACPLRRYLGCQSIIRRQVSEVRSRAKRRP